MNYGKFFRLNKNLSRIEDGFAIYDYIDLPAYFAPSMDNKMSPKYPISLMITSSSVIFRLHYSAFKIEERGPQGKDLNYLKYYYDHEINDNLREVLDKAVQNNAGSGFTTKIAHMEEVVLELPYTINVNQSLAGTIKSIYNSEFPQKIVYKNDKKKGGISTGGRYLEKLIRKRYLEENVEEEKDIHSHLYQSLRRISDGTPSYSTLWLMGLVMGEKDDVRYIRTEKKGDVVGFLRKLLLDFMFDLKHSDVFQNSAYYQQMYSGLMSNFYFSALMHKCEYYYYRDLTEQAIKGNGKDNKDEKEQTNAKQERIEAITTLYAEELVKAEDLWVKDIMSPYAENEFEHRSVGKKLYQKILECPQNISAAIFTAYELQNWPSWFAEPEEEMRRVCFAMKENDTRKRYVCNADSLIKYLLLRRFKSDGVRYLLGISNNKNQAIQKMIEIRNDDQEKISRWFLRQYDFGDVLHLHWFKPANILFLLLSVILFVSLFGRIKLRDMMDNGLNFADNLLSHHDLVVIISCIILIVWALINKVWKKSFWKNTLMASKLVWVVRLNKLLNTVLMIGLVSIGAILYMYRDNNGTIPILDRILPLIGVDREIIILLSGSILIVAFLAFRRQAVATLHLFLPRLVASITLAWLTMSMGFDWYLSYFADKPNTPYIFGISVIVLFFVMYSINLVIPHSSSWRKLSRSLELMVISYFISLAMGFIVINFVGPKFLERGGYINDFYTQYVENDSEPEIQWKYPKPKDTISINKVLVDGTHLGYYKAIIQKLDSMNVAANDKDIYYKKQVDSLVSVQRVSVQRNKKYPIAAHLNFWGMHFFVLRDFLVMFSFVAMFIGIFIQLIIFGDNKQMTEL